MTRMRSLVRLQYLPPFSYPSKIPTGKQRMAQIFSLWSLNRNRIPLAFKSLNSNLSANDKNRCFQSGQDARKLVWNPYWIIRLFHPIRCHEKSHVKDIFSLLTRFITGTSKPILPPTTSHLNEMIWKPILFGILPYIIGISLDKEMRREDIRRVL